MELHYTIGYKNIIDNSWDQDKLFIKSSIQADIKPHNHDFFELAYITGGTAQHTLNGAVSTLKKGNYFIIDYGSQHCYKQSKDMTLINCLFLPEIIDDAMVDCHSFGDLLHICLLRYNKLFKMKNPADCIFYDDGEHILDILTDMYWEFEKKQIGYQEILKNRLLEIIVITMRSIIDLNSKNAQTDITLNMMDYIHSHYKKRSLLNAYCERYHYSQPYISRKFKQETGLTVREYLQRIRIEKSCELLAGSNLSIADIAESVGYMDVKSFSFLFKRLICQSPREYRKQSLL